MKFPWFDNPEEASRRGFIVEKVEGTPFTLVKPSAAKHGWEFPPDSPYGEGSELCWRSSLLDANGEEISGGLPKFLNLGEIPDSPMDLAVEKAVVEGTVLLTLKEDGSLVIRSVHEGEVIWRTRGSASLNAFEESVMQTAAKYPVLLDPAFAADLDLHFEYIGPDNQIVIRYNESDLVLIHAKSRGRLLSWEELSSLAEENGLRLVALVEGFSVTSLLALRSSLNGKEEVGEWKAEGIVARDPETGCMVKIKGDKYLALHRLVCSFRFADMVEICERCNVKTIEGLRVELEALGFDWECVSVVEEWFPVYLARKEQAEMVFDEAALFASDFVFERHPESMTEEMARLLRKEYASEVAQEPKEVASFLFMAYDQKFEQLKEKLKKEIILLPVEGEAGRFFSLQEGDS